MGYQEKGREGGGNGSQSKHIPTPGLAFRAFGGSNRRLGEIPRPHHLSLSCPNSSRQRMEGKPQEGEGEG